MAGPNNASNLGKFWVNFLAPAISFSATAQVDLANGYKIACRMPFLNLFIGEMVIGWWWGEEVEMREKFLANFVRPLIRLP